MCGIAGYYCLSQVGKHPEDLRNAVGRLRHRGPDFQNVWHGDNGIGLGHSRLAILDLSEQGNQPMVSPDGRYYMVYNGEVYNYQDLKKELVRLGYNFIGNSDSEVVLKAFIQWGKSFVHRLVGMYAIGIWDSVTKKLSLIRDRVGVKPLYYAWDGKDLYFASELSALKSFRHLKFDISLGALGEYFQYGYISSPRSIYNNVYKLPPGHILEVGDDINLNVEGYWDLLKCVNDHKTGVKDHKIVEELEELAIESFKLRMISDVPVGVFLSGGIDSSLVTAILQKNSNQQIHTFTIGFRENKYDESVWAKKIAEYLGTKHTEFILELNDAKQIIDKIPYICDEPMGDSSIIPTYMVSKLARQEVKVALSADGGDELFGGYESYSLMPQRLQKMEKIPKSVRSLISKALKKQKRSNILQMLSVLERGVGRSLFSKGVDSIEKLADSLGDVDSGGLFALAQSHWRSTDIVSLLGIQYSDPRNKASIYRGTFEEQMMFWDFYNYLPDDILVKVDRATMAVSLEGREPMLDHRLVEFAYNLPIEKRLGEYGSKHILKELVYKYLPRELVDRKKQGFSIPIREWLRSDLSYLLEDYLNVRAIKDMGLFNPEKVDSVLQEFKKGQNIDATKIWLLLNFSMWYSKQHLSH